MIIARDKIVVFDGAVKHRRQIRRIYVEILLKGIY